MSSDPTPDSRLGRLELLQQTALLDSRVEGAFDRIIRLLAAALDFSAVGVHLVGERDHFFTSTAEATEPYTQRKELSCRSGFCEAVAASGTFLAVNNVAVHPEYNDDPSVRAIGAAAFAAAPMQIGEYTLGSLCIFECEPRSWSRQDQQVLEDAARSMVSELEARATEIDREETRAELETALEQVRESEERFRLMVEGSEEVFFYEHDLEHRFTYLSPSVHNILGYQPAELLGHPYDDLLTGHPSDEAVHALTQQALESGERGAVYHTDVSHKNGQTMRLEIVERPVVRDGAVVGAQGFARDVTERQRTETARRQIQEQLRQAQKMEAIGQLAGGIAHDFNNLLAIIKASTQFLIEDLAPESTSWSDANEIATAADRAAELVRQLLAFGRKQMLRPQILELNAVVQNVGKMLTRLIGDDIVLEADLCADVGHVRADPSQLEQVLVNLAINARDAMPGGGRITIMTRTTEVSEPLAAPDAAGSYVLLSLCDNGTGMDDETLDHIFEPFFTTKEQDKGTGLGLATVYGITKQSGGWIEVDSKPGEGSCFHVYLPLVEREVQPVDSPASPTSAAPNVESKTVLIVEDDEPLRALIQRVLGRKGLHVMTAEDGPTAIQMVRDYDGRIDVILSDVVMPKTSVSELHEQLQSLCPDSKFIFMSGYTEDEMVRRGVSRAEVAFLEKPFSNAALVDKVREVLEEDHAETVKL